MKIAVTYADGQVYQHFGHAAQFKLYTVESGMILDTAVVDATASGHSAMVSYLQRQGVNTVICGGIGGGARSALAEAGIQLYPGASGSADAQVEALLAGSLAYDPNTVCSHHDHGEGHTCGHHHEGGHTCGGHDHGCGHHG